MGTPKIELEIFQEGPIWRQIRITNRSQTVEARICEFRAFYVGWFSRERVPLVPSDLEIKGCCNAIPCVMPPSGQLSVTTTKIGSSFVYKYCIAEVELESGEKFRSKRNRVVFIKNGGYG